MGQFDMIKPIYPDGAGHQVCHWADVKSPVTHEIPFRMYFTILQCIYYTKAIS